MKEIVKFKSKAQNLKNIRNLLKQSIVLPFIILSLRDRVDVAQLMIAIKNLTRGFSDKIIVRSSSQLEDSVKASNAGAFVSVANVNAHNSQEIIEAIEEVRNSLPGLDDEILIQPMLTDLKYIGVAFTVDKDNLAPYYCIEYDLEGNYDAVTGGGSSKRTQKIYVYKSEFLDLNLVEPVKSIVLMLREIESVFNYNFIDVEFAIDRNGKLYCLQVRPLVIVNKTNFYDLLPNHKIQDLKIKVQTILAKQEGIFGDFNVLGVMPDWNPAEMIGIKPKPLSLSLYKELITDYVWAKQRFNYGYKDLRGHPLLKDLMGVPYIDVRLSLNSFLPKDLNDEFSNEIINDSLLRLINNPDYHDKIEFKVINTCYDFSIRERLRSWLNSDFSEDKQYIYIYICELKKLTLNILNPHHSCYLEDLNTLHKLPKLYKDIEEKYLNLDNKDPKTYLTHIKELIELCKEYGTLPFAGIARAAFISMSLLNSLIDVKVLTNRQKEEFLRSLDTVASRMKDAAEHLNLNNADKFLKEYGHLRAGTYDILSPRYDEAFDKYFNLTSVNTKKDILSDTESKKEFSLDISTKEKIDKLLIKEDFGLSVDELFSFFSSSIVSREYAKFEFTKLVSRILVLLTKFGETLGLSKEELSYINIQELFKYDFKNENFVKSIKKDILKNKDHYLETLAIKLPELISKGDDVYFYKVPKNHPSFVTQKQVEGKIATNLEQDISGKIVLIKAADPGYDFIFTKNIKGLITCYGGVNSHMAIRASELAIPAVLGVGEEAFSLYKSSLWVSIDCVNEQIICH